jgi:hypothetical protein
MMAVYQSPRVLSPVFYYYDCGDTYDGGVLVPEGIIHLTVIGIKHGWIIPSGTDTPPSYVSLQ